MVKPDSSGTGPGYGSVSGVGKAVQVMIIYTCAFCIFRICYVLAALKLLHTIDGVLMGFPLSWTVGIVMMLIYMKKEKLV